MINKYRIVSIFSNIVMASAYVYLGIYSFRKGNGAGIAASTIGLAAQALTLPRILCPSSSNNTIEVHNMPPSPPSSDSESSRSIVISALQIHRLSLPSSSTPSDHQGFYLPSVETPSLHEEFYPPSVETSLSEYENTYCNHTSSDETCVCPARAYSEPKFRNFSDYIFKSSNIRRSRRNFTQETYTDQATYTKTLTRDPGARSL